MRKKPLPPEAYRCANARTRLKIPTWCRNFRRRLPAPARGRGRMQRQIARAFAVHGPEVTSSQVYDWVFTRRRRASQLRRHGVWRILMLVAVPVGRAPTIGRPILWRLRDE
jgi:hypothetical protein